MVGRDFSEAVADRLDTGLLRRHQLVARRTRLAGAGGREHGGSLSPAARRQAAIVWLPGSIWAWYSGHHGAAIFLFLWGALVTSFLADNVLRPLLTRGAEGLSTMVVFLGVFGGLAAFGLLGIFIGPMALVVGVSLIDTMRRRAHVGHYQAPMTSLAEDMS
jgi:hypothetical protein